MAECQSLFACRFTTYRHRFARAAPAQCSSSKSIQRIVDVRRPSTSSPKLEFYNLIKHEFNPEKYLSSVKLTDTRKSLTKLRISCHNLYIERGRYETPIVPRDRRSCIHCLHNLSFKTVEDEFHVLVDCPLYDPIRKKFDFLPENQAHLACLLSDQKLCPQKINSMARAIHAILSVNKSSTAFYNSPEFHLSTGACTIL